MWPKADSRVNPSDVTSTSERSTRHHTKVFVYGSKSVCVERWFGNGHQVTPVHPFHLQVTLGCGGSLELASLLARSSIYPAPRCCVVSALSKSLSAMFTKRVKVNQRSTGFPHVDMLQSKLCVRHPFPWQ